MLEVEGWNLVGSVGVNTAVTLMLTRGQGDDRSNGDATEDRDGAAEVGGGIVELNRSGCVSRGQVDHADRAVVFIGHIRRGAIRGDRDPLGPDPTVIGVPVVFEWVGASCGSSFGLGCRCIGWCRRVSGTVLAPAGWPGSVR